MCGLPVPCLTPGREADSTTQHFSYFDRAGIRRHEDHAPAKIHLPVIDQDKRGFVENSQEQTRVHKDFGYDTRMRLKWLASRRSNALSPVSGIRIVRNRESGPTRTGDPPVVA